MKITICGKGGCGKSTVTSLLAKEFARMGKTVLVVDSDESNFGLHRQLGVELPRDYTEYFGGKDKAFKKMMAGEILDTVKLSAFAKNFFSQACTISEIPQEYVAKKDGVMLISSGKIHRANEGCACTMNKILEQFVDHLTLSQDEIALLDTEAGVEHFGRRTSVGGYAETTHAEQDSAQFDVSDHRTLDEVVRWLLELGYVPSFCTACYREGRTGDRFMSLVKTGKIADCCTPNALMTLKEYLEDYASPETRALGEKMISKEVPMLLNERVRRITEKNLAAIAEGKRDFRF